MHDELYHSTLMSLDCSHRLGKSNIPQAHLARQPNQPHPISSILKSEREREGGGRTIH